jgi:hypothetical protein
MNVNDNSTLHCLTIYYYFEKYMLLLYKHGFEGVKYAGIRI